MTSPPASPARPAGIVELRQYTLRPGTRADLVALFERELIEPQEAVGMRVGGVFHDRGDADRFVWLRGFDDMRARRRALADFYLGPVWGRHRDAANATMLDSDDVLLLRPTSPPRPAANPAGPRPGVGARATGEEWVVVEVYEHPADERITDWLTRDVHPLLETALGAAVGTLRSAGVRNDFTRLPVRDDANVFAWIATFEDEAHYRRSAARLRADPHWCHEVEPRLAATLTRRQHLDLRPTARSSHPASRREPR